MTLSPEARKLLDLARQDAPHPEAVERIWAQLESRLGELPVGFDPEAPAQGTPEAPEAAAHGTPEAPARGNGLSDGGAPSLSTGSGLGWGWGAGAVLTGVVAAGVGLWASGGQEDRTSFPPAPSDSARFQQQARKAVDLEPRPEAAPSNRPGASRTAPDGADPVARSSRSSRSTQSASTPSKPQPARSDRSSGAHGQRGIDGAMGGPRGGAKPPSPEKPSVIPPKDPAASAVPSSSGPSEPGPKPSESVEERTPPSAQLLEEARLIRQVQRAIEAQDWTEVEAGIRAHGKRFPRGVLVEEREAARVLWLCRAGADRPEGWAALARFRDEFPRSAHLSKLKRVCDSL